MCFRCNRPVKVFDRENDLMQLCKDTLDMEMDDNDNENMNGEKSIVEVYVK